MKEFTYLRIYFQNTVMNAWGFMMTMVLPTFTIKNFSEMMDHPDVFLDTVSNTIFQVIYYVKDP
jgi:hypothetical protein